MQDIVKFTRVREYRFIKELCQGACGITALLYDDIINEHFVCKKYAPCDERERKELFNKFVEEIKILHKLLHTNIVRIYNYYLYPEVTSGFIIMEYVNGKNLEKYVQDNPGIINDLFVQAISGFKFLESNKILHRDIRPQNIMVSNDGVLKIIDFGFGKQVGDSKDYDKSISLNWWCEPPNDFNLSTYNFSTEVYFVGKLFEKIINENGIDNFKFNELLKKMCIKVPDQRISSFLNVEKVVLDAPDGSSEIYFKPFEKELYRAFADDLAAHIKKIENGSTYNDDYEQVRHQLKTIYNKVMLEENVPNCAEVITCFVKGAFYYNKTGFRVRTLKGFINLLEGAGAEKKKIIILNLQTKLDTVPRYNNPANDDDVPF